MEWDYSGRKGRDGQKKKIDQANKKRKKVTKSKDEEVNGQGGKGGKWRPDPTQGTHFLCICHGDSWHMAIERTQETGRRTNAITGKHSCFNI